MKELRDYFVTQEQAWSLKELGFKEECLAYYKKDGEFTHDSSSSYIAINVPLIAQAFDWLYAELGTFSNTVNDGIEKLILLRNKIQFTINLTFEVYQSKKTYDDGDYLIIKEDEDYPITVTIAYGEMIDINGLSFEDDDVAYISPSFVVIR